MSEKETQTWKQLGALLDWQASEIGRLRTVLQWYADPGNWYAPEGPEASVIWQGGKGEKARVALGSVSEQPSEPES